ncbi:hypothetical protein NE865_01987 [Phthorimaea operculella]|nr:hypothetical protein NE865_01987 [Phthorimaea operculella]
MSSRWSALTMGSFELSVSFLTIILVGVYGFNVAPCKLNDNACATKFAKAVLPTIIAGDPALGVGSSDPIYVENIEGNLSILKYRLMRSTTTGFKNCDINNVKLNMHKSNLKFELNCPNLRQKGDYFISGRLIVLPVEGNGTFSILSRHYKIGVDSTIATVRGKDGRDHLQIKKFTLALEAQKPVTYDFENLFNGNKELANVVLKFANQNWKEVAGIFQGPVFNDVIKEVIGNVNKYLNKIPMESLIQK